MFLIHKVANRRPSRDQMVGRTVETVEPKSPNMDYTYCYEPMPDHRPKKSEKRGSRGKSGFFGGRASLEDEVVDARTDSRGSSSVGEKDSLMLFGKKKKLRKAASKASFQPVTEEECNEIPKSPLLRRMPDAWKGRGRTSSSASATSSARDGRISQPFNFFHISHANQRDFSEIKKSEQNDLARDWVRVSTMPLEKKSSSPNLGAPKKSSSYGLRSKFLGRYQSQTTVECEPTPCPSEESFNTCLTTPNSPSPWSPPTESTAVSPTQYVCHAITTPDLSAYGEKSAGIVRVTKDQAEAEAQSPALTQDSNRSCTPEAPIPEVRETLATPERDERRSSKRLTKRISVRIRPMSQFSDFNADFIVPGSPLLTASRLSKRFSAQVQKYQPGAEFGDFALDESWEEDIDYSYEHAAESHCDFEWERSSNYAASTYGDDNGTLDSPESSHCLYLAVPEKKKEYAERRITGQFEAHLLLPGSAGSDTASITAHDSACDITGDSAACDNGIILRAACSSLSHRSIESIRSLRSSSSVSKLLTRNFRDELARAAEHLDDHIAFLNAEEIFMNSPRDSLRPPSVAVSTGRKTLTRARTDSDATCVTLCSDAETITPIETAEIITPPNSNHNSFALLKQYDEERMAKGLSFPASTIPGVIEFSPEIHDLPVPEDEFIPFI